jgi:hypothetical protein
VQAAVSLAEPGQPLPEAEAPLVLPLVLPLTPPLTR